MWPARSLETVQPIPELLENTGHRLCLDVRNSRRRRGSKLRGALREGRDLILVHSLLDIFLDVRGLLDGLLVEPSNELAKLGMTRGAILLDRLASPLDVVWVLGRHLLVGQLGEFAEAH